MNDLIRFIRNEIRGSWRYRWTAISITWAVCLIGWALVYLMPNVYEAHTRVYVDGQSRLASLIARVGVSSGSESSVFMVRQALLARQQLELVVAESGLGKDIETEEDMDLLLVRLRDQIGVSTGRSSESRNLYTISFLHQDQATAIKVVDTLLNIFIQDVLEHKEEGGEVVSGYLDEQLAHYSRLLSDSEVRLAEFKKKYVGLLPGENGGVFERLQEAMSAQQDLESQLQIEIDRRDELRRQLSSETPNLPEQNGRSVGVSLPGSSVQSVIEGLEERRADLLLTFTERHPDVIAIDEQLTTLYEKREADRLALAGTENGIEGVSNASNPVYQSVQIALNESGVRIAALRSQIQQSSASISRFQGQVNTIPVVEAEYAQLTRDYDQYRGLYRELLVQKERARLGSVGAERDVVEFNIIEPPMSEKEPVAPKRTLLLVAFLIIGLGAGAGTAFIMHKVNPVFMDATTLYKVTGLPVLGQVSLTWLERFKVARLLEKLSLLVCGLGLIVVFVAAVALQDMGVNLIHNTLLASAG